MKIKKGDNCIIIAGNDKGKIGKVLKVFPSQNRVLIEGANFRKKHIRSKKSGEKGQIAQISLPLHISNVMLVENKKRTKFGIKVVSGKKVRIAKKTGKEI